jgi:hypothetical protein
MLKSGKTVTLEYGHEVDWWDWTHGGGNDLQSTCPVPGSTAYCDKCESDMFVESVNVLDYPNQPGKLIVDATESGNVEWVVDVEEFEDPLTFIEYLERYADLDDYAAYYETVFATDEAIKRAIAGLNAEEDDFDKLDKLMDKLMDEALKDL